MATGIILLGHGSRIPEANEHLKVLADQVREILGGVRVEPCYMMRTHPNLAEGIATLVKEGRRKIVVVPMFFSNGLHVQRDIPEQLAAARERYPDVEFIYGANLGADRRIAEVIVERIQEVAPGGFSV
ncbi:sirohydrochlorin chelatase [Neomoorella thermoacetica]|uniref:Sirohydrochlorin cobaltochelatase n=3 Tax=Neomoorella thermoacetica TaxID=1525 RepID=A0A1D7XA23_NEOTH|nr:CbiX/SirB N-terminal domain-containing protein [Moorella thermoacetica]AKX93858.1 sirohydrochlorin cobaltochelatase [Moorella thermoacetica]AKX96500.1 sirohydrochlorin cobaltochelatase [Moorella thermoacetica]AOQ23777.1 Sirohydrochlorin cobaltochelatase [Moorella thermoacetica]APC08236.1 sirohydrochlorin cobaltochelatase [Moorella thermoacetica]OIQ08876.1 sirohydrochlorin cobaltochelatase [Moorella thermoacetica]